MFSVGDLIDDLLGATYTGINHVYTARPRSMPAATLPAMWPRLPAIDTDVTDWGGDTFSTATVYLYVALQPTAEGQTDDEAPFELQVTALDAINETLAGLDVDYILSWKVRAAKISLAVIDYWGLIVEVTAKGDA